MKKGIPIIILIYLISCNQKKEEFSLCGLGITKPYSYTGLQYKGEIYKIEKEIRDKFQVVQTKNSGIAKIRFKVNCHGQIGDLHYESYDENYVKIELNDTIKLQLIEGVSGLRDWIAGTDDKGEKINSHSFLSFRIENGKIKEILPK